MYEFRNNELIEGIYLLIDINSPVLYRGVIISFRELWSPSQ